MLVRDVDEAVEVTNRIGPEHLEIVTADDRALCDRIDNAGAIFLGPYSPVAVGDYAAGPSHVLPTGGTARFTSGLSANDFLRRSSVLSFTKEGLEQMAPDVVRLAASGGSDSACGERDRAHGAGDVKNPWRPGAKSAGGDSVLFTVSRCVLL